MSLVSRATVAARSLVKSLANEIVRTNNRSAKRAPGESHQVPNLRATDIGEINSGTASSAPRLLQHHHRIQALTVDIDIGRHPNAAKGNVICHSNQQRT